MASERLAAKSDATPHFKTPTKPQEPERQVYKLPLDETTSLLFSTFKGTPYVLVVRRKPKPTNPGTLEPSTRPPFYQLGLIARAMRAGYCATKSFLLSLGGDNRYPARFFLSLPKLFNRVLRSLAAPSQSERTSGVVRRPLHIHTPLPEAARETKPLVKRIG